MAEQRIVIVGAGQGGFQAAVSLRKNGFAGRICLLGDEPELPYQRPPLSKAYLLGQIDAQRLQFKPEAFYEKQRIERRIAQVQSIDPPQQQIELESGERLGYDHLILATGARNRIPALPGVELAGVQGLRTHADADRLRAALQTGRRVVVIGAGFIGLEFAAAAVSQGLQVNVVEQGERPMQRALSAPMAERFQQAHESWGVSFHCSRQVSALQERAGRVGAVELADGASLAADLVLYGIGVEPNVALAEQAGLAVDNGIQVDEHLLTSDAAISALGDVASFPSPYADGRRVRLESVQNASEQARCVAARLTGNSAPYSAVPWFWSDQGDMKLQIAGLLQGHDETRLLGEGKELSVLCFRRERLIAVESCNRPADHIAARRLLARGARLTPAQAEQPGFDLKTWEAETRPETA